MPAVGADSLPNIWSKSCQHVGVENFFQGIVDIGLSLFAQGLGNLSVSINNQNKYSERRIYAD